MPWNLFKSKNKDKDNEKEKVKGKNDQESTAPHKITIDDFEQGEVLGKGTFGEVIRCVEKKSNKVFAMKIIDKGKLVAHERVKDIFTERNILSRANHPYVVKLYYTFQSERYAHIVMDYCEGGNLDQYLSSRPQKVLDKYTTKLYLMEIVLALLFLHENKIMYRDLKPENILLCNEGHCHLADFGLSKDFRSSAENTLCANSVVGSPFYVAPDVLEGRAYTNAVDFWSLGILTYRMIVGCAPFTGKSFQEIVRAIRKDPLSFPSTVIIPDEAKDLILRLLTKQPDRRLQGESIKAHPYWEGISWEDVMAKKVKPPKWKPKVPFKTEFDGKEGQKPGAAHPNRMDNSPSSTKATAPLPSVTEQEQFTGFTYVPDDG